MLLAILGIGVVQSTSAQISKRDERAYRETSAELREAIWALDLPHFKEYTIPPKYKLKSRVVMASLTDLNAGSKRGVRRGNTNITLFYRQLVLLNDAASVRDFSDLSYTQLYKGKAYYDNNKVSVFIGARVVKPGGKVAELNADDVVLTKDAHVEKQVKLAVPDLQPGDMLDYYVAVELNLALYSITSLPYEFPFYDDVPVLHHSVHCSIGKKFAAEYRSSNAAPDFKTSVDDEGNNLLDIAVDSLMLVPGGTPWISPMRQFPIIQLNVVMGDLVPYTTLTRRRPGTLIKNQAAEVIIKDEMIDINHLKVPILRACDVVVGQKTGAIEAYYNELRQGGAAMQEDSAAAELYYLFRYELMFKHVGQKSVEHLVNIANQPLNGVVYAYMLSEYFKYHGMSSELVLTTSGSGPRMNELLDRRDIRYLCNVHKTHDMLFGMSNIYSPAFFMPAGLEGIEDAVAVDTKGTTSYLASNYTQRKIRTPGIGPEDNLRLETLAISPARRTSLTGHFKDGIQQKLLPLEDFYNYERQFFNDQRSLAERMRTSNPSGKVDEELNAAVAYARKEQEKAFLSEAKDWMEEDVTNQTSVSIINPGVRHTAPAFEYASAFRINSVLKKGGDNYLLEVGKLIGHPRQVSEQQRSRTVDVHMQYANTVRTDMTIRIPDGYEIEGLAELNRSVSNNAGRFTVSADASGGLVSITVEKVYSLADYSAKDWPSLLMIMDAAAEWTNARLLLRKKAEG